MGSNPHRTTDWTVSERKQRIDPDKVRIEELTQENEKLKQDLQLRMAIYSFL